MNKCQNMIDINLNVFHKPYQTIATIRSLLQVSGKHIDKIYINFEAGSTGIEIVKKYVDAIYSQSKEVVRSNYNDVMDIRYQYGLVHSDKKYVFISHNDVLYKKDIIGAMLEEIADNAGIGLIGQCWNCPLFYADVCDGKRFNDNKVTDEEFKHYLQLYPQPRLKEHHINGFPFPECRLNEFACLVDREIALSSDSKFGLSYGNDTAQAWFTELYKKGHTFKHFNINDYCEHGYWAGDAGHNTNLFNNKYKYDRAEEQAKKSLF